MSAGEQLWVDLTNIALGAGVLAIVLAIAAAAILDVVRSRNADARPNRRRAA